LVVFRSLVFSCVLLVGLIPHQLNAAISITCGKKLQASAKVISVVRVVDGDTQDVLISLKPEQFGVQQQFRTRLLGVDTYEKRGSEKPLGLKATTFSEIWLSKHKDSIVSDFYGVGKFGRSLVILRSDKDKTVLNIELIKNGHHAAKHKGKPYCGGSRK